MSILSGLFSTKRDLAVWIRKDRLEVDEKMGKLCNTFTDEEWALMMFLPVDAYYLVATADGALDHEVSVMFGRLLDGASTIPNKLLAVLLGDIASGGLTDLLKIVSAESEQERVARMERMRGILKKRLSTDQYRRFLGQVLVMAQQMAKAAGSPVGDCKKQALMAFAARYQVNLQVALACTCPGRSTQSAEKGALRTARE